MIDQTCKTGPTGAALPGDSRIRGSAVGGIDPRHLEGGEFEVYLDGEILRYRPAGQPIPPPSA